MSLASEDHVLAAISRHFPDASVTGEESALVLGRGDDCAVLRINDLLCVSTDLFLEDVHFRRRYFSPEDIGWKALAVNLSDLAACGARPEGFSMAMALPPDADMALVDGILTGMAELATATHTTLTGGDLARAERLHLCITVMGSVTVPLKRAMAQPGDHIFLLGTVGLARTGLLRLEAEGRAALRTFPDACAQHLRPKPRIMDGRLLHELALAHPEARLSLMDVSDGLARDLPRLIGLAPSGKPARPKCALGADIILPLPHPEIARYCAANELDVDDHLMQGGEDYGLIGTCAPECLDALHAVVPSLFELGVVSRDAGVRCNRRPVREGFDHFG